MRHGAIHGETNSCPKAIHARKGNSLAIGCHAAPGRVLCKKSEMFDYPSGFLPVQKATSPDNGRLWRAANPEGKSLHSWTGMEGIRKGTSRAPSPTRVRWKWYDVIVGAAICRPPTPDHNPRKRAADSRPYICGRGMKKPCRMDHPAGESLIKIIPKGYLHAPWRNSW